MRNFNGDGPPELRIIRIKGQPEIIETPLRLIFILSTETQRLLLHKLVERSEGLPDKSVVALVILSVSEVAWRTIPRCEPGMAKSA